MLYSRTCTWPVLLIVLHLPFKAAGSICLLIKRCMWFDFMNNYYYLLLLFNLTRCFHFCLNYVRVLASRTSSLKFRSSSVLFVSWISLQNVSLIDDAFYYTLESQVLCIRKMQRNYKCVRRLRKVSLIVYLKIVLTWNTFPYVTFIGDSSFSFALEINLKLTWI